MATEIFRGRIPDHLLYDPTHDMWVRREGLEVVIGATAFGIHLAGEVIAFTAKPRGAEILAGKGLGTVECAKTVLAVHAPIGIRELLGNEALEDRPDGINRDPYQAWMARGVPIDWDSDSRLLVDAAAYRIHVRSIEPEAVLL